MLGPISDRTELDLMDIVIFVTYSCFQNSGYSSKDDDSCSYCDSCSDTNFFLFILIHLLLFSFT
jgi:hypothetical protein